MLKTQAYKERLQEEKVRLERMIASRRTSALADGKTSGVNDSFSNSGDSEYADAATDTYTLELDFTLVNKYRDRLQGVNAALARIEEGHYGQCVRCHSPISAARLDAIPETPYCRDCEADVEVQA